MLQGHDELLRIEQILVCADMPLRDRLMRSVNDLDVVLHCCDSWPVELQSLADRCRSDLVACDNLTETLHRMNDRRLLQLVNDLLELVDAIPDLPASTELECQ